MLHCPIHQVLALLAAVWVPIGTALADPQMLRLDGKYDHDNEITVCLSSDEAKKFYHAFEGANVYTTGCFPAKLGDFSPMYRVDNIKMITETEVFGFDLSTEYRDRSRRGRERSSTACRFTS